jgi:GNAT superfamily N-acetyltransferase
MLKTRGRNKIIVDGWKLEPFVGDKVYKFDCVDDDLNSFFKEDVREHDRNLMVKTFVLAPVGLRLSEHNPPSAFISFCNDAIRKEAFENRSQWKKITKKIPPRKRYDVLPAVKIARLGVDINYRKKGIGAKLLNMTRELFLTENRTGCRFLTVDAYITKEAIDFYSRNGFDFFTPNEKTRCEEILKEDLKSNVEPQTVAMWFDLFRAKADIDQKP